MHVTINNLEVMLPDNAPEEATHIYLDRRAMEGALGYAYVMKIDDYYFIRVLLFEHDKWISLHASEKNLERLIRIER